MKVEEHFLGYGQRQEGKTRRDNGVNLRELQWCARMRTAQSIHSYGNFLVKKYWGESWNKAWEVGISVAAHIWLHPSTVLRTLTFPVERRKVGVCVTFRGVLEVITMLNAITKMASMPYCVGFYMNPPKHDTDGLSRWYFLSSKVLFSTHILKNAEKAASSGLFLTLFSSCLHKLTFHSVYKMCGAHAFHCRWNLLFPN